MIFGLIGSFGIIIYKQFIHTEEDLKDVWQQYYNGIDPPKVINSGEIKTVTVSNNKCFAYICQFNFLQERVVKFEGVKDYTILLCENSFYKDNGNIYIKSYYKNTIIIDKFCSFESKSSINGHFTFHEGEINSTILQGSICNGGNSSVERGMILAHYGNSSLSKTNFSNCISKWSTAFLYWEVKSTINISFCNFEKLESESSSCQFGTCDGIIEKCNYINNFKTRMNEKLIYEESKTLHIFDSVFKNNSCYNTFKSNYNGFIYIHRCNIDKFSSAGSVYTSEMATDSFNNDLKFIKIRPCEGSLIIVQNNDKYDSILKDLEFISIIDLFFNSI